MENTKGISGGVEHSIYETVNHEKGIVYMRQ